MTSSIILTIHNKENVLYHHVLPALINFTKWEKTDIVFVLDGCNDMSEMIVRKFCERYTHIKSKILITPDVYETAANNAGIKQSEADYVIILQDDIVVNEQDWNLRILKPFQQWDDVFAVSGNCAHNWSINPLAKGIDADGWSDLLFHHDHANKNNTERNVFAIRDSCNRGPLAINRKELVELGYFDQAAIYRQDMDDHDLMFRMKKSIGKKVGYLHIEQNADITWGGTRDATGKTKQWLLDCQIKNTQLVLDRHRDIMYTHDLENRLLC